MKPVVHIVGARPNFPKLAPVRAALAARGIAQVVVHTGQHYDAKLSDIFFEELGIPAPDRMIGVGSGSQAEQTAKLLIAIDGAIAEIDPAVLVVYGDVNSTVAGALVGAKRGIPTVHVEAGLRSFDRSMPEEINRLVADRLADLCLTTSEDAINHLRAEGIEDSRIRFVGNPMIDSLMAVAPRMRTVAVAATYGLAGQPYAVATLHRAGNVDDDAAARPLVEALIAAASRLPIVAPLHPPGAARLAAIGIGAEPRIHLVEPMGYIDFTSLVAGAACVITDSGGVQEETTILRVPCLTLRPNTERPVTITHGTNRLVTPATLIAAIDEVVAGTYPIPSQAPPRWDGKAGERIADAIVELLP